MIRIIYMLIWFLIVPESIGLGILNIKKDNRNMIFALVIGYIFEFAFFQCIAIPMIFMHLSFKTLAYTWAIMSLIFSIVSLFINKKELTGIIRENIQKLKQLPKILLIIFVLTIFFQCFMCFKYMHQDYDDFDFVAKAVTAVDTNTLYKYRDNGALIENNVQSKKILSPFPMYLATISTLINLHPTVVAHTILPVVFIPLAYLIYSLLGSSLFKGDKNKTLVFLVLLSVIFMWGDHTRYSIFVRLLYRIWQGKSVLASMIIPFIWYLFIEHLGKENDTFYWGILLLTLWGADLVSSMSLVLPIIVSGFLTLIYMIKDRKFSYGLKFCICCVPSVIYGIIYLIIK